LLLLAENLDVAQLEWFVLSFHLHKRLSHAAKTSFSLLTTTTAAAGSQQSNGQSH